jgi:hypothetical protein
MSGVEYYSRLIHALDKQIIHSSRMLLTYGLTTPEASLPNNIFKTRVISREHSPLKYHRILVDENAMISICEANDEASTFLHDGLDLLVEGGNPLIHYLVSPYK